jgi:CHAT domain-containing protein/Tfp pilus assembly protein PilF
MSATRQPLTWRSRSCCAALGLYCLLVAPSFPAAAPAQLPPCAKSQRVEIAAQPDWRCRLESKTQATYLVRIDRQHVDVSLELLDARGSSIVRTNSPTLRAGRELLLSTTDPQRQPTLVVASLESRTAGRTLEVAIDTMTAVDEEEVRGLVALTRSATIGTGADRDDTEVRVRELMTAARHFKQSNSVPLEAEAELRIAYLYYYVLGDWQQAAAAGQRSRNLYAQKQDVVMEAQAGAIRAASLIELAREQNVTSRTATGSRNPVFDEIRRLLEKAATVFRAAGMPYDEAHALNNLGIAFYWQGRGDEARVRYEQAERIFATIGERQGEALALQNLAALEYDRGNYAEAVEGFQALLERLEPSEDAGLYVTILNNYAIAAGASGRLDQALNALLTALPLAAGDVDPSHRAATLNALGGVYLVAGETERATTFLRQALELRRLETTHDPRGLLTSLIRNGDLERETGNLQAALALHSEALRHAVSNPQKARSLLAIGRDQLLSGSAPVAVRTFERALALELDEAWPVRASLLAGLGQARMLSGDPTGRELVVKAVAAHRNVKDNELAAHDLYFLAEQDYRARNLQSALALVEQTISLYESQQLGTINPDLRATYIASRADAYDLQAAIYMSLRSDATDRDQKDRLGIAALASIESLRLRALEDFRRLNLPLRAADGKSVAALDAQIASKSHRLQTVLDQQNPSAERVTALRRDLALLRSQLDVSAASAAAQEIPNRRDSISLARIQDSFDADTAMLSWLLGHERSWVWCVTKQRAEPFELQGRRKIEEAARALHEQWSAPNRSDNDAERRLSHLLIGDAGACLQGHRSLIVVPDGVLRSVPVAALWVSDSNGTSKRVIETHAVSYRPALTSWHPQHADSRRRATSSILLVGDPVLSGESGAQPATYLQTSLRALPGAGREVRDIASITQGWQSVSLVREQATRKALLAQPLRDFRVIHFATHALLDVHDPQLSALVLSGSSSLTLRDVMNLELQTDVVVLGACDSSLGKEYRGQLSLGLSEAFLFAGADNVLGSLWPVSDAATAHYMRAFYEQYVRVGTPSAAARTVALSMMRDPRYAHPFYWAAFVNLVS